MVSRPDDERIPFYADMGMGTEVATAVVPHINADMGRCILALYRDAAQPAIAKLGFNMAAASQRPRPVHPGCGRQLHPAAAPSTAASPPAPAPVSPRCSM